MALSKVLKPHDSNETWHEWVYLDGYGKTRSGQDRRRTIRLDNLGRRHPHAWREWIVLHCNNSQCDAEAAVDLSVVVAFLRGEHPEPDGSVR